MLKPKVALEQATLYEKVCPNTTIALYGANKVRHDKEYAFKAFRRAVNEKVFVMAIA